MTKQVKESHAYVLPSLAPDGYDPTDPWYASQVVARMFGLRPFAQRPWTPNLRDVMTDEERATKVAWAKRVVIDSCGVEAWERFQPKERA